MADLGSLVLRIRADLSSMRSDFDRARDEAGDAGDQTGRSFTDRMRGAVGRAGSSLTKTLTPAAAGFAEFSAAAFNEFDSGADTIVAKAGLMGDELDAATESMKHIGGEVAVGLSDIGAAIGDIASAADLSGPALEDVSRQLVELGELGQQVSGQQIGEFLKGWEIPADQAAGAMDRLFAAAQDTGVGVGEIMAQTTAAGPILREFGFTWDMTANMVSKLASKGVDAGDAIKGMQKALVEGAKSGKDANDIFFETFEAIKNAGSQADANATAIEVFGAKAGPQLAAQIRQGTLTVEDLTSALAPAKQSIDQTYKSTLDWGDKLELLKNKAMAIIGPMGQMGMVVGGLAAGLGPLMMGLGGTGAAAGGATLSLGAMASALWAVLAPVLAVIAVIAVLAGAVWLIIHNWDTLTAATGVAWDWISDKIGTAVGFIIDYWYLLFGPIGLIIHHWDTLKAAASATWDWITDRVSGFVGFFTGIPGRIAAAASGMWDGIYDAFRSALNAVIGAWNRLGIPGFSIHIPMPGPIPDISFSWGGLSLPDIPLLDQGGIAMGPTLAMLAGNSRPEAIIPLDRLERFGRMAGAGGGGPTIIVQGSVIAERELLSLVQRGYDDKGRHNTSAGLKTRR